MAIRSFLRRATPLFLRQFHPRAPASPLFHSLSSINDDVPLHSKAFSSSSVVEVEPPPPLSSAWESTTEEREWPTVKSKIDRRVELMTRLNRIFLGSYKDGERLSDEHVKTLLEKILRFHPHYEDKIGSGLDFIVVDRHPRFKYSRCFFVVRTDGTLEDFSYFKCMGGYIRDKYPSYADRYISQRIEHDRRWERASK